jgi:hypothetical protein
LRISFSLSSYSKKNRMSRNVSIVFFLLFIFLFSREYWNKWIDSRRKSIAAWVYSSFLRIIFVEQSYKTLSFLSISFLFMCIQNVYDLISFFFLLYINILHVNDLISFLLLYIYRSFWYINVKFSFLFIFRFNTFTI